jgi:hypothetical protein
VLLLRESGHPAADVLREALAAGTDLDGGGRLRRASSVRVSRSSWPRATRTRSTTRLSSRW